VLQSLDSLTLCVFIQVCYYYYVSSVLLCGLANSLGEISTNFQIGLGSFVYEQNA